MGVDFDFQSHINKTKLTASHYQQPVNQLDLVTESTQSTDLQALLQILNLVQGRLRDRFDATEQFVSLMIQMNEDRRLFITFLGRRPQQIRRNDLIENRQGQRRERSPFTNLHERIRQQEREQLPLQRRFDEQERRMSRFDFDFANPFPRSRESHFVPPIETQSQTLSVQQDMNQILPPISRDLNVLDLSIPQHQDESIVQDIVNQEEINNQSIPQTNNETVNQISLNQNSQYPIRPKIIQRQHIEQPTTCWQFLTRIVRNFLRIFR